nr:RNA-directed DNA polymerase, eukaryota, nucleotide-binding alpha-beta plait domain protein [Tanacetum cinerariifolium]
MNIQEMEDLKQQYLDEIKRLINLEYHNEIKIDELKGNFNSMSIEINKKEKLLQLEQLAILSTYPSKRFNSFCYDDDEDYTIAVTPSLSTEEPDNSLNQFEDFSDSNDEFSSTDDDSFYIDNIEYVEASPPNSELVSSEVMEIVIPEVGGIDDDILLTIKNDILREKLLNINLLIANIEALNNPTPSSDFMTKSFSTSLNSLLEEINSFDNSLTEFEIFCFDVEEISSGSTTTRSDISLPEYAAFYDDHVCNDYGTVVDVFIPNKKSKAGKHFAFVRFIKVLNFDRLIENLKTIWIGRFHLSANLARFDRPKAPTFQKDKPVSSGNVTRFRKPNVQYHGGSNVTILTLPFLLKSTLVLDDSCLVNRDLVNCVMGEVLQFSSINNIRVLLSNEGFHNARIVYLGGLWVMIELKSSKTKLKFMQHVGVASWFHRLCNAQLDFAAKELIVWVDIKGVPLNAWSRFTFQKIVSKWGEMVELKDGYDDLFARKRICIKTSQTENILESFKIIVKGKVFWARAKELFVWSPSFKEVPEKVICSDDESVKINEEANCLNNGVEESYSDVVSDTYFGDNEANSLNNGVEESDSDVVSDTYFGDNGEDQGLEHQHGESSNAKEVSSDPFNIYGLLNKRTKEVRTMDTTTSIPYPPCFTPFNKILASIKQDAPEVESDRPPNRSERSNSRVLEEVANSVDKSSSESINNWIKLKEGGSILEILEEMITVGQTIGFSMEGLGSKAKKDWIRELISKHKVSFLSIQETKMESVSAMEVKFLWGYYFSSDNFVALYGTWIPNKQKLLLILVYAPQSVSSKRMLWSYLASLITSWNGESLIMGDFNEVRCIKERWGLVFNVHGLLGFDDLVTKSWNSFVLDDSNGHSKDLTSTLSDIDKMLDQGGVTGDILFSRMEVLKQLHDVQSSNTRDIMQKAKIHWAIEGDENSKYFYAIINKKRVNLSIKGVMVDGDWIDDPDLVKQEFRSHFADRFQDPGSRRALIPKVLDPKVVSDYRPISLIGRLYKVVTKILATRLSLVISDLISDVQTAFLPNRQFLDEEKKLISVVDKMRTSISFSFHRPVRGGVESQQHDHLSVLLDSVILSNMEDRWFWDLNGDGVFRVKDVRILLDEAFLSKMEVKEKQENDKIETKPDKIKIRREAWKIPAMLHYTKYPLMLEGNCVANWISNHNEGKSTSSYVFTLGVNVVSWKSFKQTVNTISTMEAKLVALDKVDEVEWLRSFLEGIPLWPTHVTVVCIHCESMAALTRAKIHIYNDKSRHIRRRHDTIKDMLRNGIISIDYVKSKENIVDDLKKVLCRGQVIFTSSGLGLKPTQ